MFTDINATGNGVVKEPGLAGLSRVDFNWAKSFKMFRDSVEKGKKQAEVQVPAQVPVEAIEYVAFRSQASLEEGMRLCQGLQHPAFEVRPAFFVRQYGCHQVRLLDWRPTQSEHAQSALLRPGIDRIPLTPSRQLTLIADTDVIPGLDAVFQWWGPSGLVGVPDNPEFHKRFDVARRVYLRSTLSPEHHEKGRWLVRCFLQAGLVAIREFDIPFEIV